MRLLLPVALEEEVGRPGPLVAVKGVLWSASVGYELLDVALPTVLPRAPVHRTARRLPLRPSRLRPLILKAQRLVGFALATRRSLPLLELKPWEFGIGARTLVYGSAKLDLVGANNIFSLVSPHVG